MLLSSPLFVSAQAQKRPLQSREGWFLIIIIIIIIMMMMMMMMTMMIITIFIQGAHITKVIFCGALQIEQKKKKNFIMLSILTNDLYCTVPFLYCTFFYSLHLHVPLPFLLKAPTPPLYYMKLPLTLPL